MAMVVNVMTSIGREIGKYLYPKTPTQCLPAKESIRVHVRMCMVVICLRTTPLIYRTYTCNIQITGAQTHVLYPKSMTRSLTNVLGKG